MLEKLPKKGIRNAVLILEHENGNMQFESSGSLVMTGGLIEWAKTAVRTKLVTFLLQPQTDVPKTKEGEPNNGTSN